MAGQRSGWYAVGRAIRDVLLGIGRPAKSGSGARQDPARRAETKPARGSSANSTRSKRGSDASPAILQGEHESPGQYGVGATRDLTAAEARKLRPSYAPNADGDPDPGEIVWTWVPFVENDGRGKDRPVLVIARMNGDEVAGCFLTTKQHRGYVSVGTGGWDSQGRESFLAPDRVLRLTADGMRREGHVLGRERFVNVVRVVAEMHGFSG